MKTRYVLAALAYAAMGTAITAWLYSATTHEAGIKEFVCTIGDALSERHVGVSSAEPWEGGLIYIQYVDGPAKWYRPREGESCGVEEIGP